MPSAGYGKVKLLTTVFKPAAKADDEPPKAPHLMTWKRPLSKTVGTAGS